jgi:beta-galactosidase
LRIDGYLGNQLVLSRSFSSDPAQDQFRVTADDGQLTGDGADATRVVLAVTDKYGAPRALAGGDVSFEVIGPGVLAGDNPFGLTDTGGTGAIWIKSVAGGTGEVTLKATHASLGEKSITIQVTPNV